eukprot:4366624-Lingulodinium_polyedra.AAC.1
MAARGQNGTLLGPLPVIKPMVCGYADPTYFLAPVAVGDLLRRRNDRWAELRGGPPTSLLAGVLIATGYH